MISVLMSCYNSEKWVHKSIDSIIEQTFKDWELIIINDGSTDNTRKILESYSATDRRIKVYNKENSGLTDSLNFGLNKCNGSLIARIDADDIALPERLKLQYNFFKKNPDYSLCGTFHIENNHSNSIKTVKKYPIKDKKLKKNLVKVKKFFSHSSAMFKKDDALCFGGYGTKYKKSQDFDLWLKLSTKGKIFCINKPLVVISKHDESISESKDGYKQFAYGIAAASSYLYFLKNKEWIDSIKSDAEWNKFMLEISSLLNQQKFYKIFSINKREFFFKIKNNVKSITLLYHWLKFKLSGTALPVKIANSLTIGTTKHE